MINADQKKGFLKPKENKISHIHLSPMNLK